MYFKYNFDVYSSTTHPSMNISNQKHIWKYKDIKKINFKDIDVKAHLKKNNLHYSATGYFSSTLILLFEAEAFGNGYYDLRDV